MAQYLQGLMEEGMGGVETPPAGSGRAGKSRVVQLAAKTTTPRVYTPSPDITSATQQKLWPTTRQHRPPPPQDQGERPGTCRRQLFEAWAPSVEDYSSICGWAAPTRHLMYASFVKKRCNSSSTRAWGKQVFRKTFKTTEAIDVVRSVVIGTRCIIGAWAEFFSLARHRGTGVRISPSAAPKRMSAALGALSASPP
ncbi:hypothetical protein GWK47_012681 [Chionoecetes opilio]|uniref:Uncharacterized protein n=1 Tax=Chionoecetes opilio TaxID=41210 RepID=A0A8J4Y1R5_CHIOP|nr:hypothetical protein GWK47_012681 [Chionoecetes opilio]